MKKLKKIFFLAGLLFIATHGHYPAMAELPTMVPGLKSQKGTAPDADNIIPDIPDDTPSSVGEYQGISFQALGSYKYIYDEDAIRKGTFKHQIPADIEALNHKKVAIKGYMFPVQWENNKGKNFVLLVNQMSCCFGVIPPMNGWIYVTMSEGKSTNFKQDVPVTVYGILEVGEKVDENAGISIYRMTADRVFVPEQPAKPFWKW